MRSPFLLCCSGLAALSLVDSFTVQQRQHPTETASLAMGGYYNEPDVEIDQSETHMIFGVRCVETVTLAKGKRVVGLQPIDADELEYGPAIVQYLESQGIEWKDANVLEVGASSAGLALAREAASVVVCHPDPRRLQILEHANLFLNSPGKFETRAISSEQALPSPVDIIIFTMADLDRLTETISLEGTPQILVPGDLLLPVQLENYRYKEADGILEILEKR